MRPSRSLPLAGLLGLAIVGCGPNIPDRTPREVAATVTIAVPNMTCPGCPDNVRDRLSALQWVEIRSIKPDRSTRHVSFGVNDKTMVNEQDLREVLGSRYGNGMKILSIVPVKNEEEPVKAPTADPARS